MFARRDGEGGRVKPKMYDGISIAVMDERGKWRVPNPVRNTMESG